MKKLGIYIHIPFCSNKCYYCDFVSFPKFNSEMDKYIDYLLLEMEIYKKLLDEYTIKTIFIGGGTPSYIDEQIIVKILEYIYKNFDAKKVEEITIEANPETLNEDKINLYKQIGINRISIGVQSLSDKLLNAVGRRHTTKDFLKSYDLIRKAEFDNVNIDLMFGLPNQTVDDCIETLEEVIKLDVDHISYYSLILEEKTLMNRWYNKGKIVLPDEDIERQMYHNGINLLKSNGYKHYEISNFAKEGFECKHNLLYWQIEPYVGFGISAHSNLNNKRFWNYKNFKDYYNMLDKRLAPVCGEEKIDKKMEMAEYLIMGLRLIDGINKDEFRNRFNQNVEDIYYDTLIKHQEGGLLSIDDERINFTAKGLDLSNIVYVDLLP
ncbi:radical SAM family heme chaperone HemW [Schnuerera sp. xch1]|nr:radical SAM family heme chaperone HemW [Schnuerera sp. xch1]